jgi:pantoate--beta-alanine ligase
LKIFTTRKALHEYLQHDGLGTTGLVPTMGALHKGHLSLIKQAQQQTETVICSIFVNPTQFTDPADLDKYPRPIKSDIKKLEKAGCDVLFNPEVTEMYASNEYWHLDIGELEHLLEGKSRPGHYQGVTQVVHKLFDIVKPDFAFFGQKDYQQYLVIQRMVELLKLPVKLVMCAIEREDDGLAMSSRNIHLSNDDRMHALVLSTALQQLKENFSIEAMFAAKQAAEDMIRKEPGVELDYFEIADGKTLQAATSASERIVALVAAKVGSTRLIDNMIVC